MEQLIIICLLIVSILLLQDKIKIKKRNISNLPKDRHPEDLPSIMGETKSVSIHQVPNKIVSPIEKEQNVSVNIDEVRTIPVQIPEDQIEKIFTSQPDLEEEEEEWKKSRSFLPDEGLASGATFEDLNAAQSFLQQENADPVQELHTQVLLQKIHGTPLFDLLQNSISEISQRVEDLLNKSAISQNKNVSAEKDEVNDFHIRDFI